MTDLADFQAIVDTTALNKVKVAGLSVLEIAKLLNFDPQELAFNCQPDLIKIKKSRLSDSKDLPHWNHLGEIITSLKEVLESNLDYLISTAKFKLIETGVYAADSVSSPRPVVFDTSGGPILLDQGVVVEPFSYLKGPLYIGPQTVVKAQSVLGPVVSVGRDCRVGGEVANSLLQDFTNCAHLGFIGHSYLGSWVNVGGGTIISNLKNTYGPVKIKYNQQQLIAGQFMGAILADYVKVAVNTVLYGGVIVGAGSHLYGLVQQNVPPFTIHSNHGLFELELASALKTQARMFARRNYQATGLEPQLMSDLFEKSSHRRSVRGVKQTRFKV